MAAPDLQRSLTEDDLQALPDDAYRYELVEGFLLREPAPALRHARVQSRLFLPLARFVQERGLGEVFGELGFVLSKDPDTIRAPDVAFVRAEALSRVHDETRLIRGRPGLAVEILSPSNRPAEIRSKVADFLAAGTRMVWVVDPARRRVSVYRTLLAPRMLEEQDLLEGEDVIPGFALPISALFPR